MRIYHRLPPDPTLRRLVEATRVPALLMTTAHLTDDTRLLRQEWASLPATLPTGRLSEKAEREAREACLRELAGLRDRGAPLPHRPSPEILAAIARWALGNDFDPGDLPVIDDFLVMDNEDPRAPDWTLGKLASEREFQAVIVGAGFSGLLMGLRLKQAGIPFVIYEREKHLGGTWLLNNYPGCRVDVASHLYAYSFIAYDWSAYFAEQAEVLRYLEDFAQRFDLYPHIRFGTEVRSARWNEVACKWQIETDGVAADPRIDADLLISAVGQLNKPSIPDFEGRETFTGPAFHSAQWDHSVDLAGKRVGVIGTGASGLQIIPALAGTASKVTVFQRNATWLRPTPELRAAIPADERQALAELPAYRAWYRLSSFLPRLRGSLDAVTVDPTYPPTEYAVSAANARMRQELEAVLRSQVTDAPDLEPIVIPTYPPGAKRIVRDDGLWIKTLRRDDVEVVTSRIRRITPTGILTEDGTEHPLDAIVYCTGFKASEFLTPLTVYGRGGTNIHDAWGDTPSAYFGLSVPGFPNFFLIYGPNTGVVVHANLVYFFECQVRHVMDAIRHLLASGKHAIEVRSEVMRKHAKKIEAANAHRAWCWSNVTTWYKDQYGRSPIMWPLTTREYWEKTVTLDKADYEMY